MPAQGEGGWVLLVNLEYTAHCHYAIPLLVPQIYA